ncbi:MAG: hypothetical protein JOZ43_07070 [Acidobacteriales bacterium]|nr:hypothetical protein [Terriglobales bacterium]
MNDKLDDAVDELEAVVWFERMDRHSPDSRKLSNAEQQRYRQLAERCRLGNNDRVAPVLESFDIPLTGELTDAIRKQIP